MLSFAGPLPNGSVIEVELFAIWRGILELEELGVQVSFVEGDSKEVAGWALGSLCMWMFLDKIEKIQHSIATYNFKIAWASRQLTQLLMKWCIRG